MLLTFLGKNNGAAPEIVALKITALSMITGHWIVLACGTLLGLKNLHLGAAEGVENSGFQQKE